MESKIMASILNSKGVTVAYATPTPRAPKQDWACAGLDPELFFPEDANALDAARTLCGSCLQRDVCLTLGQARAETGVWGGVLLDRGKVLEVVPVMGRPRKAA